MKYTIGKPLTVKNEIENNFLYTAERIGLLDVEAILQFQDDGMGTPYIDLKCSGEIFYVIRERGVESSRKKCASADDALYHIFSWITHDLASKYSAAHRKVAMDSRRGLFEEQLKLLGRVSDDWRIRREAEIARILREAPYNDQQS
ncbi:Imm63 family immunity protein [Rhizobium metallidurans]|uniref:Immunity protein 63 domain-containing protein n=1 Tax=Rhizobium metallidurans TaxID=1265931 RepID=A0A7W6D014_9HYPH|nr:Imm63 family immunity protein [Rhizobium metallidurans]MBB3966755.1 hypothetical protein [Rhizobium metallidurans]